MRGLPALHEFDGRENDNEYTQAIHAGIMNREHEDGYSLRQKLVSRFAWAIPTNSAINGIAAKLASMKVKTLVSIGAGTGYWESLISKSPYKPSNCAVVAYDLNPPIGDEKCNPYRHVQQFMCVDPGGPEKAAEHGEDSALFLSWPPYDDPMAAECLKNFVGKMVVFVGEGRGGCTGDDKFHKILKERWKEVAWVDIPRWYGINDYVNVYVRRGA